MNKHWVSDKPFNPYVSEEISPEQEKYFLASQWTLIWWKFKKHKVAMFSMFFLVAIYFVAAFAEFFAPYALESRNTQKIYSPPQQVHFFADGSLTRPYVTGWSYELNLQKLLREYQEDPTVRYPVQFFCQGDEYQLWGMVNASTHLMCVDSPGTLYILGTDRLGHDMLVANYLRRQNLSDYRPDWYFAQFYLGTNTRWARWLLRWLDRSRGTEDH